MPGMRWGRLQVDVNCALRRGAWYRVVGMRGMNAVVDVNQTWFPVPSYVLEVVSSPPRQWTIVPAPARSSKVPRALTPRYAVCPSCRERTPVSRRAAAQLRCPRCRGQFDVAWNEGYLSAY